MNTARLLVHYPAVPPGFSYGRGIGIAFLDTGIFLHRDFIFPDNRILMFKDFIEHKSTPYDDNGHGTHICGIACGNGSASKGRYAGIAPKSHLIVGKVLDKKGNGSIENVAEGISWILKNARRYNIRILNISIGAQDGVQKAQSLELIHSVETAWDFGLVVVVAAGNNGPKPMSVTAPGISPKVITVGASDDDELIDSHGQHYSHYSGRGPLSSTIIKPDLVAPGSNILSCCHKKSYGQYSYTSRSGTSMATPMVSGAAALLLGMYPKLTNTQVKYRLQHTCTNLGFPPNRQGYGQLDIARLLYD